jgi:3-oxoacyl-[acyl-carrier-protein] synthase-3
VLPTLHISRQQRCRLLATGVAFPERFADGASAELDNEAVVALLAPQGRRGPRSTEEQRELAGALAELLGVERRRWSHRPGTPPASDEVTTVDLQQAALERALATPAARGLELGALIATTSTPPRVTAGCAPAVAARLGLRCAAFDLRAGCAGGVHALIQAALTVEASGQAVAIVAADTFSKLLPPGAPLPALAFGDGAAAAILAPASDGSGVIAASLAADGSLGHLGTSASPFPPTTQAIDEGRYLLAGDPEELARQALPRYAAAIAETLELAGVAPSEIDLLIPQQAGRALCAEVGRVAGVPPGRVLCDVARHANIGSGSVGAALHHALAEGRVGPGARVLFAALGGGLCWGAALFRL